MSKDFHYLGVFSRALQHLSHIYFNRQVFKALNFLNLGMDEEEQILFEFVNVFISGPEGIVDASE